MNRFVAKNAARDDRRVQVSASDLNDAVLDDALLDRFVAKYAPRDDKGFLGFVKRSAARL